MKIKDVQIDGFGVWSGLSVHSMPDTMTVFYGPNEAGKTTLMQFLRTMFYGFTTERRQRYLPPVYTGKPGGAIRVTGPGGGYQIARRATLDQDGTAGSLSVTGNDGLAQGQHRLAMLLGQVDESIFTNVFAIGLRELQELSTLDDTAAADELYKLSSGLDRVSLVDVTRQLRAGRKTIVGPTPDHGQMQQLMLHKDKLRDEIDSLTSEGRRWSELAALRNSQQLELDELKHRIGQWELEAKSYEVALQVRTPWLKRSEIQQTIDALNARTDLPDSVAGKVQALSEQRADREEKLEEIKHKRRSFRDQARRLPLRRGILELAAKIEAATEQSPWISSMHKNIQRLENQLEQTREQLLEDATRLGVSEEDQEALLEDRRMTRLPDLSRQSINQLAEPASDVRMWSTRLKQAKQQCETEKQELERLDSELSEEITSHGKGDIKEALQSSGETVALLRKRIQIQETLDKQIVRKEQLEEEAINLTCDEALPVDRAFLMGFLFVGGAFLLLWGLGMILPFFNTADQIDSQSGLLFVVGGMFMLFFGFMWSNVLDRSTVSDLEGVEDQIDAIRKEIRKTETEREEYERRLPPHTGTLDVRLREAETEITELESLLPIQHNREAAKERYRTARKRAAQAADSLRSARTVWQRTLAQLGLAESLSPKSIRIMAEGYDSLLQTKRRLQNLEEEIETRQLELGAITQRVDSLSQQVFAAKAANDETASTAREFGNDVDEPVMDELEAFNGQGESQQAMRRHPGKLDAEPVKAGVEAASRALEQLNKLNVLVSSQEQFIRQKRSLREQDQQHAKQMAALQKNIDKIDRSHSSLLAEYGCESEEQLHQQLETKHEHERLTEELAEYHERIQALISAAIPYETIQRLLDGPGAQDLEKRWEAVGQRTQQAEQRVEALHQRQGEIGQEMKSLAAESRLAEAKLELACVENQLKSCAAHWQTLAVTTGLLDRVCEVYETERQPETLREASAFLNQLTEGKYVRIWTPLGKNQLRIDNANGTALPLEVLSRGTREAVFISLRLSLAAAYARRGVTIPLVLDDVLVNFDSVRAESAARVLRDFAALGHQVVMFTCHEHIMQIFYEIDVQVRVLPPQGHPGEAEVYYPELIEERRKLPDPAYIPEPDLDPEPVQEEPEQPPVEPLVEEPVMAEADPDTDAEPEVATAEVSPGVDSQPPPPEPNQPLRPVVRSEPQRGIDWLWYEQTPAAFDAGWIESEDRVDEKLPPPDLWWSGAPRTTQIEKRAAG